MAKLGFMGKFGSANVYATPTTSRCADVSASALGTKGGTVAFLASNGRPWWSIRYGVKDRYGHLTRGHGAKPIC